MELSATIIIAGGSESSRKDFTAIVERLGLRAQPLQAEERAANRATALLLDTQGVDDPVAFVKAVREDVADPELPVLLVLTDNDESQLQIPDRVNADDFITWPYQEVELQGRLRKLLWSKDLRNELSATLELTRTLASSLELHDIFFTVVRRIAEVIHIERVSLVLSAEDDPSVGYVIAASDDEQLSDLRINLNKYPEIQQVLRTGESLTIDDVATHPVLDAVRDSVPDLKPLSLFPLMWQDSALGVLFLRSGSPDMHLSDNDRAFCDTIANATALAVRNARVVQKLREDHLEASQAQSKAEERLAMLEQYADLFTASTDGITVFDRTRRLLFANPKAYEIVGKGEQELVGVTLAEILLPESRERAEEVWNALSDTRYLTGVDLALAHPDGARTLSASFSLLPHDESSILVHFRDVTEERRIAEELRHTKEFLESMIEASVDAIVAADLTGKIILYNGGAERIYGHRREDVINKLHVSRLYPEGVAKEVMRKIRDPEYGGEGRLESMHSCAVDNAGQLIPISLSAAMIYENDEPVATVGIFTDLREKILAEERLAQAQKKLEVSEKQALLAELAGTAAHELNQPLTSVMGYGELLSRKLPSGTPERNAATVIVREAERMADLVRKIGKITKYETKSYVGDQRILDLDKASDEEH